MNNVTPTPQSSQGPANSANNHDFSATSYQSLDTINVQQSVLRHRRYADNGYYKHHFSFDAPKPIIAALTRINCEHAHTEPRGREVEGRSSRDCTRHRDHIRRTRRRRVACRLRSGKDLSSAAGGDSLESRG